MLGSGTLAGPVVDEIAGLGGAELIVGACSFSKYTLRLRF